MRGRAAFIALILIYLGHDGVVIAARLAFLPVETPCLLLSFRGPVVVQPPL